MAKKVVSTREPKDLRYRKLYFPHADELVFDTARKGFVPLPILLRKVMRYLSAPEIRALIYLELRASKYGICYPTIEEMAFETGLEGRKNLIPCLRSLESKKLISTHISLGRRFYLVHDPRVALTHLAAIGKIPADELVEINRLCEDLGQEPITPINVTSDDATGPEAVERGPASSPEKPKRRLDFGVGEVDLEA